MSLKKIKVDLNKLNRNTRSEDSQLEDELTNIKYKVIPIFKKYYKVFILKAKIVVSIWLSFYSKYKRQVNGLIFLSIVLISYFLGRYQANNPNFQQTELKKVVSDGCIDDGKIYKSVMGVVTFIDSGKIVITDGTHKEYGFLNLSSIRVERYKQKEISINEIKLGYRIIIDYSEECMDKKAFKIRIISDAVN